MTKNIAKILIFTSLLFCFGCASSTEFVRPGTDFNKYRRIAVMPLVDFPNYPQSGIQVSDLISMRLMTTDATILDRTQVSNLISELKLGMSGLIDENTAPRIGNILGVQALFSGSVNKWQTVCNNIQIVAGAAPAILCTSAAGITLKLIDVETGRIVWTGSAKGATVGINMQAMAADKAIEKNIEQLRPRLQFQGTAPSQYVPVMKVEPKKVESKYGEGTCEQKCTTMHQRNE